MGKNEYGLGLSQVAEEVKSEQVQNLLKEKNATTRKTPKAN